VISQWFGYARGVLGVLALLLTAVALPPLLARLTGGHAPGPGPQLAALAPAATLPALAAVAVAALSGGGWWLALLLALPAALLLAWQLPPIRPNASAGPVGPGGAPGSRPGPITVRVLTLNTRGGSADPAAVADCVRQHQVDVLALQELTPGLVDRLDQAGLGRVLPHTQLDPRPDFPGAGLWARWPLTPLPPVAGLVAAAPRARIEPATGRPVVLITVHPLTPLRGRGYPWQRDLARLATLADRPEPQVVAGDFNASRDHRPFRELLAAGFVDCADAAQRRTWPGFTWPASWDLYSDRDKPALPDRRAVPLMRLDHVLVSPPDTTVRTAQPVRVAGTDHYAVLAVIEFA
jgi:endonuclease/exonuclease/phosphatase family metal-dependent hydrolase